MHEHYSKSRSANLKSEIQSRKLVGIVSFAVSLVMCGAATAQQPKKLHRIGFLSAGSPSASMARIEAFRQGLRELGYVDGKSILIEDRYAEGKFDRLDEFAAEFVRLKVDVILTAAPSNTRAAKKATSTIPIVMAFDTDPVGNGFVASLARPGGNITGLSMLAPEISGKQLELLKETLPKLSRVAVLGSSTTQGNVQTLRESKLAAGAFGVKLQYMDVADLKDIETAFRGAVKERADAVLVLGSAVYASHRREVTEIAVRDRLPTIYRNPEYVDDGGLMAYGVNLVDLDRRAATYVDKILKGAKPGDIPVEQPKQIGVTIPQSVLYRADRIIK